MNLPHTSRSSLRRSVALGAVACSTVALTALGGTASSVAAGSAPAGTSSPTMTTTTLVDPAAYLSVTGARGYGAVSATPLRVVKVSTGPQLAAALATAKPGDRIELASGTYTGPFSASASGTLDHPIVVRPAAGAVVQLTAKLAYPTCGGSGPDPKRTFTFVKGASHWVLQGLKVDGGIIVVSQNADEVLKWQESAISSHDWQTRRAVPGAATRDAVAARDQVDYLAKAVNATVIDSTDVQLLGNTVTGKGIFGRMLTYGVLSGNTVSDIACGTGPAIWLANYSRGNVIGGNVVTRVATSSYSHYMQEGIRLGNGSDYNVVVDNRVRDLPTNGRGITTDQDSSWNLITGNRVNSVDIAYNEEMSGWGNTWTHNVANNARVAAYSFRMEDGALSAPSRDTSSFYSQVSCNIAWNSPVDVQVGAIGGAAFRSNRVGTVKLSKQVVGYWAAEGNTWNGSSTAPSVSTPTTSVGC